ncbi:hypothetical protein FJ251_13700 [bacterium]|nr:hypothetical protein [bacterium]
MALKLSGYIKGPVEHRRTESDYMGTLLETVTLEDWREVVEAALTAAKAGDASARTWLTQYLVGKSRTVAPAPLTVVAHHLSGRDQLVEELAKPFIDAALYPMLTENDEFKERVRALVAAELREAEDRERRRAKAKATRAKKHDSEAQQVPKEAS